MEWGIDYTGVLFTNIEKFTIQNNQNNGANFIKLTTEQVNGFEEMSGKFTLQILEVAFYHLIS